MLTPELLGALRSSAGAALLARAAALRDDPFAAEKLRREASLELAAAAVEQVRLRQRAAVRFSRAAEMWFSPALLEQASGDVICRYRARRFAGRSWREGPVADLCCGLGADTLALAAHGAVTAVDRDPLARALAAANAEALGAEHPIHVRPGEVPGDAPALPAAWCDPGRREGGSRTRSLELISPSLRDVLSLRERIPSLGVKLSPASKDAELDALLETIPHEREFISVAGECRELAVWIGELAAADDLPRRATVLPAGAEIVGRPLPYKEVLPPGEYLIEPDPAVIRAGLVGNLAAELEAWPIDPQLAYLSCDRRPASPLGQAYRVAAPEAFSEKRLSAGLREHGAGDVVLKTRGVAIEPEILRHKFRAVLKQGRPDRRPVVFITRLAGRAIMMMGERLGPGEIQQN